MNFLEVSKKVIMVNKEFKEKELKSLIKFLISIEKKVNNYPIKLEIQKIIKNLKSKKHKQIKELNLYLKSLDFERLDIIEILDHIKKLIGKTKKTLEDVKKEIISNWRIRNGFFRIKRNILESLSKDKKYKIKKVIAIMRKNKVIVLNKRNYFITFQQKSL